MRNQAPQATNDSYSGTQGTVPSIAVSGVLSNDSDPNCDPLTAVLNTNASDGMVVLNPNGIFTYTSNGGLQRHR